MIASQSLHLDFPTSLFIHSYIYSFIHECSYWTYGPRSASFTFRALNLWLHHPLANVVSSGGNTAWSMDTFSFFLFVLQLYTYVSLCGFHLLLFLFYCSCAHSKLPFWVSCAACPALLFLSRWPWPFFSLLDQLSHHLFRHCTLLPSSPYFSLLLELELCIFFQSIKIHISSYALVCIYFSNLPP